MHMELCSVMKKWLEFCYLNILFIYFCNLLVS